MQMILISSMRFELPALSITMCVRVYVWARRKSERDGTPAFEMKKFKNYEQ